jgi:uncharacterized membrane protein YgdD (TMEM256/DUF423 family)
MSSQARLWIAIGALLAAIGVGLGAYGAHGLRDTLAGMGFTGEDLDRRMANFETAVRYQMFHAIGLIVVGIAIQLRPSAWFSAAACAFLIGIVLFCGLLKVLTFAPADWKMLGAIVPVGGLSMIVGWLALAMGALMARK